MAKKDERLSELEDIKKRWENFLNELNEKQLTSPGFFQKLSVKEILAHLTAWQQMTAARLVAARNGNDPIFPGWFINEKDPETEEDLDAVNLSVHDLYFDHEWMEIRKEWEERFEKVLKIAESIPSEVFDGDARFPWLEGYPLMAVLDGTLNHHLEHLEDLIASGSGDDLK
ncbi:MAG TPA: ClbS/DfsB family four-helix bundle protein [Anaerolineales bacterium]|nr:ClbS/DfsB family four-helix bundle protein [Anaerolineales bacterium]